ncbi:MAG: nucleotidyl transferase AbiEii/AbiGii toxin family protein [Elusimicrobia bacterium]|nr:nucleotidyl transferase AbiEii/AbiGii toxin family protein [Elusimicrobiota bacterium]
MKPLRILLGDLSRERKIQFPVLEKDYVLSWVLAGIGKTSPLGEQLVFKGGTALKKCYFGEYRFSEDLDFSALETLPRKEELLALLNKACERSQKEASPYVALELACARYEEKKPHPGGQEAFKINARLPWQRGTTTVIWVEITLDEPIPESRLKMCRIDSVPTEGFGSEFANLFRLAA